MIKLTIKGRIPSKKNSKIMVCRGRFPMLLPSANYTKWHKESTEQLKQQKISFCKDIKNIIFTIYAPDNRKSDLSNKWESVGDLLVDNKIIEDDNWFIIPQLSLIFGGVDKENPRCEIVIS